MVFSKKSFLKHFLLFALSSSLFNSYAQTDSTHFKTMPASENYHKPKGYKKIWGEHYRKEWHTPVTFPIALLDTLAGGVTPYQAGGGRQSKSLRLRDKNNREYVLRSIDKTFSGALPEDIKGHALEDVANDQVTFSNPYSAPVVAALAEVAGIHHTNPIIYYVPKQPALKEFNDEFGNVLYLFEQRPDEDWSTAENFGNSENIVGTEKMLSELREDNSTFVNQELYLRSRLFDMFIGDWGRHEDQWRWATFKKEDDVKIYDPIPRDRDNAFTRMDGLLPSFIFGAAGGKHMEDFGYTVKNIETFNYTARNLDRRLLNALPFDTWTKVATDLTNRFTDEAIDEAVKKFPPEIYPISAAGIAARLKSRRSFLNLYAQDYYEFLAKEVDIPGSEKAEKFVVSSVAPGKIEVQAFDLKKDGTARNDAFYTRIFDDKETKEIRLFGIEGNDQFHFDIENTSHIKIRLIGSKDSNSYTGHTKAKVFLYDKAGTEFNLDGRINKEFSKDSSVNNYNYESFIYNKIGTSPVLFYSFEDRIFLGFTYKSVIQQFRKQPFGQSHALSAKYSISQKAVSLSYLGTFMEAIGKWNLQLFANWDMIRWRNFFGPGNENEIITNDRNFNRMRFRQVTLSPSIDRVINNRHHLGLIPSFDAYDVFDDADRYLAKLPAVNTPDIHKTKYFGSFELFYTYQKVNDSILPVKGISWKNKGGYTFNLKENNRKFWEGQAEILVLTPLSKKFSLSNKIGGAMQSGTPEVYQFKAIGGNRSLRGIQRDRFYGHSTLYNQNELRWITDVRSRLYNGKFGIFALYDQGRVWMRGEQSDVWHSGYGGGIILSPFNKIAASVAYARSKDDNNIHIALLKDF